MRGMTWDHPRGIDPLLAASEQWFARTGVRIEWDRRSLQDFETWPVDELARRYDLIVIDHPHVGVVAAAGALLPFTGGLDDFERGSVGRSFASYRWEGRQWALPIDAAAQVQAWVPQRIAAPPASWQEVLERARAGTIGLPMRPPHSLMSLMTLCGLLGIGLDAEATPLFPSAARAAVELLAQLAQACQDGCYAQDPIAVLEEMARPGSALVAAPLIYGYVSYGLAGFRPVRIAFADLVPAGADGPRGSVLGGTGIAVSAQCARPEAAVAFARWLAGGEVQRSVVARSGGQPAHADAWDDDQANAASLDFYRATRRTLELSWLRPRHDRYMPFQHAASLALNDALRRAEPAAAVLARLNALQESCR